MELHELDTPALVVDLDILTRNIRSMADYANGRGLKVRPHIKTHKTPEIARMQMDAGATGVTVAKISEAEVMIHQAGIRDILVAYPVVGRVKTDRLALLAKEATITVAVDSFEVAKGLSQSAKEMGTRIGILLDRDVGFRRTGFESLEALVDCAKRMAELPALEMRGLFCFPGHILEAPDRQGERMKEVQETLLETRETLARMGIPVGTISSGSTPTAYQSELTPVVTEIRPGTYVFNDANYLAAEAHALEDCALTVHTTVVSDSISGQVIVDGGSKTFSSEACLIPSGGYGKILDYPEARFTRCSEEHGWIDVSRCSRKPRIGERFRIIPNHVCPAVNLHDRLHVIRGGKIETVWTIAARGRVQ